MEKHRSNTPFWASKKNLLLKRTFITPVGYMSFSFAQAHKTDPIVDKIGRTLGEEYLKDLPVGFVEGSQKIPVYHSPSDTFSMASSITQIMDNLPVPPWIGSNSWVLSPSRTKSGKVVFANDTHIMYSQPGTWYEAHLEAPGLSLYGNHLAGFPFAPIGHNRNAAWGLTMFQNDDTDFYYEKINPENENQAWVDDHWEDMQVIYDTIAVKGEEDVPIAIKNTRHGPLMDGVLRGMDKRDTTAISMFWVCTKFPNKLLEACSKMAAASDISDMREAASMIHAPGTKRDVWRQ